MLLIKLNLSLINADENEDKVCETKLKKSSIYCKEDE